MAVRIRKGGTIVCAAMHPEQDGDTYIDDELHYMLSVIKKVLVTEPHEKHCKHGLWWWKSQIDRNVEVDPFYKTN